MTADQFAAYCALLPGTHGLARIAAGLVLVHGDTMAQAVTDTGVTPGAVYRVIRRIRELERGGCPTCGNILKIQEN